MENIILWTNNKDYSEDKLIAVDNGDLIFKYSGQSETKGNSWRNKRIKDAKFLVGGIQGKRMLIGKIKGILETDKVDDVRMFYLVIKPCNDNLTFRTKNELASHYGWNPCDDYGVGITKN